MRLLLTRREWPKVLEEFEANGVFRCSRVDMPVELQRVERAGAEAVHWKVGWNGKWYEGEAGDLFTACKMVEDKILLKDSILRQRRKRLVETGKL